MNSSPHKLVPAWLQASPFGAVFAFFFVAPLLLIVAVSFWPTSDYALVPGFTGQNYVSIFEGCANLAEPCVTFKTYELVYYDDATCRLEPIDKPFSPNVLPMSPE